MYYTFTTLTTVGFGDFHPKGNAERIMIALILFFGVMCTTLIVGDLISLLSGFKTYIGEPEDYERLAKFFGALKNKNGNALWNHKLRVKIRG